MRLCMLALTARAARGLARTSATTSATAPNKVVFVGAGSFGSAMALVAARAQPDASIKIWARRDAVVDEINVQRRNGRYLPEDADPFPSNVEATTDLSGAVQCADVVVLAVPGEFLGTTLSEIDLDGKVAISLVKSARQTKGDVATVCEDVEARFGSCRACALSGQGGHDPVEPLAGVLGGSLDRREAITHRRHNRAARPTAQASRGEQDSHACCNRRGARADQVAATSRAQRGYP